MNRDELDRLIAEPERYESIGGIIVDTNDPRYREEIHEQYRASLEKSLDDGELRDTLEEMGYRLEPVTKAGRVIAAFEAGL